MYPSHSASTRFKQQLLTYPSSRLCNGWLHPDPTHFLSCRSPTENGHFTHQFLWHKQLGPAEWTWGRACQKVDVWGVNPLFWSSFIFSFFLLFFFSFDGFILKSASIMLPLKPISMFFWVLGSDLVSSVQGENHWPLFPAPFHLQAVNGVR